MEGVGDVLARVPQLAMRGLEGVWGGPEPSILRLKGCIRSVKGDA